MIYRYDNIGKYNSLLYPTFSSPQYDSVVDYSSYRPDSENTRHFSLSGSGVCCNPLYDDNPDDITLTELQLRTGKLDKAEVSQLILSQKNAINQATDQISKEVEIEKLEKLQKERQEYLDKSTGFTGIPQDS